MFASLASIFKTFEVVSSAQTTPSTMPLVAMNVWFDLPASESKNFVTATVAKN